MFEHVSITTSVRTDGIGANFYTETLQLQKWNHDLAMAKFGTERKNQSRTYPDKELIMLVLICGLETLSNHRKVFKELFISYGIPLSGVSSPCCLGVIACFSLLNSRDQRSANACCAVGAKEGTVHGL